LAIIGLVSAVTPVPIPGQILTFDLWFMLSVTALMLTLVVVQNGLRRWAGAFFLGAFAAYTTLQYYGVDNLLP
jgi:cation:H+ antiporter